MFKSKYPYTTNHELNLDWIINKIKSVVYSVNGITPDGDGNIEISGLTVDEALSTTSENPVQNKLITTELNKKYEKPSAGIPGSDIADSAITTTKINNSAVTSAKIASSAVSTEKISNSAVTSAKIASGVIPTELPSPGTLTLTGGVTGSYDGSEDVTINIPTSETPITIVDAAVTNVISMQIYFTFTKGGTELSISDLISLGSTLNFALRITDMGGYTKSGMFQNQVYFLRISSTSSNLLTLTSINANTGIVTELSAISTNTYMRLETYTLAGSSVSVDQVLTSGTEIGGVTVDSTRTALYAPKPTWELINTITLTAGENYTWGTLDNDITDYDKVIFLFTIPTPTSTSSNYAVSVGNGHTTGSVTSRKYCGNLSSNTSKIAYCLVTKISDEYYMSEQCISSTTVTSNKSIYSGSDSFLRVYPTGDDLKYLTVTTTVTFTSDLTCTVYGYK